MRIFLRIPNPLFLFLFSCSSTDPVGAEAGPDVGPISDGGAPEVDAPTPNVCIPVASAPIGPTVTTVLGQLRGAADVDLVVFRGIPYAEPPIGARRFRPPP